WPPRSRRRIGGFPARRRGRSRYRPGPGPPATGRTRPVKLALPTEMRPGERRVALVPDVVKRLVAAGWTVAVQAGAGQQAAFGDQAFADAGADVVPDAAAVDALKVLAQKQANVFSFDLLPRISRAQSMDALSSQATVSGYRAGLAA